jgi:putative transposase
MDHPYRTRGVTVPLDPTPAQAQLLRSYCGASRFAYNWTVAVAKENKDKRKIERNAGIDEADLTKSLSWSAWSMTPLWNSVKDEVAPWHRDVTKHAFRSGVTNASIALKNYQESAKGIRRGPLVGFPKFKNRHSKQSFTLIELKRPGHWFSEDSRHVRLILPRFATDPRITRRREHLQWLHTTESLSRLKKKVMSGEWAIQAVTISFVGGRWQASFSVRQLVVDAPRATRPLGALVGVDLGVKNLATLTVPVTGLSDDCGHVANPRHLNAEIVHLDRLDRQLKRCQKGSKNRAKIRLRRQRLYGRIARTRNLYHHRLTTTLAGSFETVVLEDLRVSDMVKRSKKNSTNALSRSILDAGFYELRRQLIYKAEDRGHRVVVVGQYYPSSKMCSHCGETKAKLALSDRVFECSNCGISLDRDVNAARNIRDEGIRLLSNEASSVAGHQPETINAVSRDRETGARRCDGGDRHESRTTHPARELSSLAKVVEGVVVTPPWDGRADHTPTSLV